MHIQKILLLGAIFLGLLLIPDYASAKHNQVYRVCYRDYYGQRVCYLTRSNPRYNHKQNYQHNRYPNYYNNKHYYNDRGSGVRFSFNNGKFRIYFGNDPRYNNNYNKHRYNNDRYHHNRY
jgi:hypothetical protein